MEFLFHLSLLFVFKRQTHSRAKVKGRGQGREKGSCLELRIHNLPKSNGPGQDGKTHGRTYHTGLPMEKVRKPIPEGETPGWVREDCSAGNPNRKTGLLLHVGTGPLCPAYR